MILEGIDVPWVFTLLEGLRCFPVCHQVPMMLWCYCSVFHLLCWYFARSRGCRHKCSPVPHLSVWDMPTMTRLSKPARLARLWPTPPASIGDAWDRCLTSCLSCCQALSVIENHTHHYLTTHHCCLTCPLCPGPTTIQNGPGLRCNPNPSYACQTIPGSSAQHRTRTRCLERGNSICEDTCKQVGCAKRLGQKLHGILQSESLRGPRIPCFVRQWAFWPAALWASHEAV